MGAMPYIVKVSDKMKRVATSYANSMIAKLKSKQKMEADRYYYVQLGRLAFETALNENDLGFDHYNSNFYLRFKDGRRAHFKVLTSWNPNHNYLTIDPERARHDGADAYVGVKLDEAKGFAVVFGYTWSNRIWYWPDLNLKFGATVKAFEFVKLPPITELFNELECNEPQAIAV